MKKVLCTVLALAMALTLLRFPLGVLFAAAGIWSDRRKGGGGR